MEELNMRLKKGAILATMEILRDYLEPHEVRCIEMYVAEPLNKENLEHAEMMLRYIMQMIEVPVEAQQTLNSYHN